MERELVVTDDLVGEAVRLFLEVAPRTMCLSGGSTPRPVYEALADVPYGWSAVEAFFGDERCVPPDHPDSNVGMAARAFLDRVPVAVYPIDGARCDADGYETVLRGRFGDEVPRFDLTFLGLGDDGHTASLFPSDPALEETERWVVRVEGPGQPPHHPRITMTLPVLSASRLALFLVSGRSKQRPLARLLEDGDVPAARVAADRVVVLATRDAIPEEPAPSKDRPR